MNRVFIIGGRSYNVSDPTIEKLSLAGKEFEEVPENVSSFSEAFEIMGKEKLCKVLSYLISGDLSLTEELSYGSKSELVLTLGTIYGRLKDKAAKASKIASSISMLVAKPKV